MRNQIAALQRKLQTEEDENADHLRELEKATDSTECYKQENISLRLAAPLSGYTCSGRTAPPGQGNPEHGQLQGHGRMGKRTAP